MNTGRHEPPKERSGNVVVHGAETTYRRGAWAVAAIVAAVVLAGLTFWWVSSATVGGEGPPAAFEASTIATVPATTAATAEPEDVASDGAVTWQLVDGDGPAFVTEVVRHDAAFFAVALVDGRLELMGSPDATEWGTVGVVCECDHTVHAFAIGDRGFVVGVSPPGSRDEPPNAILFASNDGVEWTDTSLPLTGDETLRAQSYVTAVGMGPLGVLVAGEIIVDAETVVRAYLDPAIEALIEQGDATMNFIWSEADLHVAVVDAEGSVIVSGHPTELGVPQATSDALIDAPRRQAELWWSDDLRVWEVFDTEGIDAATHISQLHSLSDGSWLATGWTNDGGATWEGRNGEGWVMSSDRSPIFAIEETAAGTLAISGTSLQRWDGGRWSPVPTLIDSPGPDGWNFTGLDDRGDRLVATALTFDEAESIPAVGFSVIGQSGLVILYDKDRGIVEVLDADNELMTWIAIDDLADSSKVVPTDDGTEVSILDPAGDVVATMAGDEFDEFVADATAPLAAGEVWGVVVSEDAGSSWSVSEFPGSGQPGYIRASVVATDGVVLVWQAYRFDGTATASEIWMGSPRE